MESIRRILKYIEENRLTVFRYILMMAGIAVLFNNLIDCINENTPAIEYLKYVVVMGVLVIVIILIQKNWILVFCLGFVGIFGLIDVTDPTDLNGNFIFIILSNRIANTLVYSILMYFAMVMAIVVSHTLNDKTPSDAINMITAYTVLYGSEYLVPRSTK